ncbi:AAA domain-containing protein [Paenibacillus cellulosilyticus]|uniref:AAA domain-containing protein n=1 Tax=Paenibacillus cellulosilyticus TaxID=375489 RepID=A0A2V2YUA3_9BACL|nr:AAA family ATPase [Paenibacillus cellulosilyticus]PWW00775.1 AAA domain-containing protein [Paenibacillus cellulosilyticus]QKS45630.1 AAA family ATPase [Paenibacillus cellulosilyticus]
MQKLIFFVGVAGTGKTTVARKLSNRIPAAFLDRDTVGGRFVEHMLVQNGLDPNDRDSDFYKKNLRDLEYDTTKDICIENLAAGQNVFMISPFTAELKNKQWIEDVISAAGLSRSDVDVKVVVVTLSDMETQRTRIIDRQTVRDQWKLDNWDSFATRVQFVPEVNWDIPQSSITVFDNSGVLTDEKVETLFQFVEGKQTVTL